MTVNVLKPLSVLNAPDMASRNSNIEVSIVVAAK
jgi:hypothetical protein